MKITVDLPENFIITMKARSAPEDWEFNEVVVEVIRIWLGHQLPPG